MNPLTEKQGVTIGDENVIFDDGTRFKSINSVPIIIDESRSIFKVDDILKRRPTAQNLNYRKRSLKNDIRKKVLPGLSKDFNQIKRYKALANRSGIKSVLVIGAGDKVGFYNDMFKNALVITSDVHLQFHPDVVFDAHQIPFIDGSFDLIIASQVLEHTFKPWEVANELERVVSRSGYLLVETPFNFPYHSPPYDFFRFTFTGLRSLFPNCELETFEASEGSASAVATYNAQFLIDLFSNRYLRMLMVFLTRYLFGWMKYLDKLKSNTSYLSLFSPMGFSMVFKKDDVKRSNMELLDDYYKLKS
ncbi:class I SAM-dependent methyltransferase [Changchengzhania lutea]|uniref:class I SAM-dependent methyltransferase n=1 Tax=Changchengzhania lutea TaxID=2049305 RepID=UPI00163DC46A|nr:class I SAM-dependent methyltransferase [Changchengzhania lutea]